MEKKDIVKILDEILLPMGFKKKGNYWALNGEELNKLVNLQKSQYSDKYYINYGYVLKSIVSDGFMHVANRIAGKNRIEQQEIDNLFDLETEIPDADRILRLKEILTDKMAKKISLINSEVDILKELKSREHLNDIRLVVKKHFGLDR